jgi:hypothetical protein
VEKYLEKPFSASHWPMIGSISTICPLQCDFCFRKGNPNGLVIDSKPRFKTIGEVTALLEQIVSQGKELDFLEDVGDYLCNREFFSIIRKFREYFPYELIDFTTSGINLTRENIKELAGLGPLFLQVSLNSANPRIRSKVMQDPHPEVAIEGIKLLREYRIPFSGTIVAWPTIPEDDIRETILYLNQYEPVAIKINLPGYTRFFPGEKPFDTALKWSSLVSLVEEMKAVCETPLSWEPYLAAGDPVLPIVTGVVKNSPAARAGLRKSDLILEIDGEPILFREQARQMLIQRSEKDCFRKLLVERDGVKHNLEFNDSDSEEEDYYPHKPVNYPRRGKMFGAFIHQGLDLFTLKPLAQIIHRNNAAHVLFISSILLASYVETLFKYVKDDLFPGREVAVATGKNRFFGGNVMMGDLLVVPDFLETVAEYIQISGKPDLIVIPSSPFNRGVDLLGNDYRMIGVHFATKIELLPVGRILV